jgi:hypothetical protein
MPMVRSSIELEDPQADLGAGTRPSGEGLPSEFWFVAYNEELLGHLYVAGPFDEVEAKFWACCLPEGKAFQFEGNE